MFRRKPDTPKKSTNRSLSQYGLFDVPDNLDDIGHSDDSAEHDSDLEAELAALNSQGKQRERPKPKPIVPAENLAAMVAESMKDIPSDEDISDTDDPDILNELEELTLENEDSRPTNTPLVSLRTAPPIPGNSAPSMVNLLEERIKMYSLAEEAAKSNNESSRARRFGRGVKTLKDLLKQAKAGNPINDDDIPPAVNVTTQATKPTTENTPSEDTASVAKPIPPQPDSPTAPAAEKSVEEHVMLSDEDQVTLNLLTERRDQYKSAAVKSKKEGDNVQALAFVKTVKQFDKVISALKTGQPVDISNMPPPPGTSLSHLPSKEEEHVQTSSVSDPPQSSEPISNIEGDESLITASSVEEALKQRLDLYKKQEATAHEQQNTSKARRMGRIVKQFEQAIKLHAAGKPIPIDELPTPPGYAPIPVPGSEVNSQPEQPPHQTPKLADPVVGGSSDDKPATTTRANSVRKMGNQKSTGHVERQIQILQLRQREFKEAALNAKKKGEIPEAKEFLRCAKGLEPLIDAAMGGLPVDLSTVPLAPQSKQLLEDTFDMVSTKECNEDDDESTDLLVRLEEQLTSQLKMCLNNRDHLKALGDIAGSNRFEHLALNVKQDLDVVKLAKRLGSDPPKFHYETREFSIVQCCTDLNDNDLELTIVRGLSYGVANPKQIDTYVKFEFPYPQEQIYIDRTQLIKDTNSPEYNSVFTLPINRTARPCLRVFKRHGIKFEVYSRGCCGQPCSCHHLLCFSGLFVRDALIGTTTVKLQPLESLTELHDTFDLMDGRKKVGGKLEVKLRVRHPLLTKQIEQVSQKWLLIDH